MASDRSNYTSDLHVGITTNPLVWQLQTNMTITPPTAHTAAAPIANQVRIHRGPPFDERGGVGAGRNRRSGGVQPHSAPRIGGTMVSFETNDATVYGVLLIGRSDNFYFFFFGLHFTMIITTSLTDVCSPMCF